MAAIITFDKNEKFAMLKIMIEVNNNYSSILTEGVKFIHDTATFFNLSDQITEVYNTRTSDALNILGKAFRNKNKEAFFTKLLSYMLKTDELSNLYNRINDLTNGRLDHERKKDAARLNTRFRQTWTYAFALTHEILKTQKLAYNATNPLECTDYNHLKEQHMVKLPESSSASSKSKSRKEDDEYNIASDFSDIRSILLKELREEVKEAKEEMIKELREEVKEVKEEMIKELKMLVRDEIKRELHHGMKNFVHDNFNEILYKDL